MLFCVSDVYYVIYLSIEKHSSTHRTRCLFFFSGNLFTGCRSELPLDVWLQRPLPHVGLRRRKVNGGPPRFAAEILSKIVEKSCVWWMFAVTSALVVLAFLIHSAHSSFRFCLPSSVHVVVPSFSDTLVSLRRWMVSTRKIQNLDGDSVGPDWSMPGAKSPVTCRIGLKEISFLHLDTVSYVP